VLLTGLFTIASGGANADGHYYLKAGLGGVWSSSEAVVDTHSSGDSGLLFPQPGTGDRYYLNYSGDGAYQIALGRGVAEHWRLEAGYLDEGLGLKGGASTRFKKLDRRGVSFSVLRDFSLLTPLVQPYLGAGLGAARASLSGETQSQWTLNMAAGVALSLSPHWLLDLSYGYEFSKNIAIQTADQDFNSGLRLQRWQLGVRYQFAPRVAKIVDSDGDGVADLNDRCPQTLLGAVTDHDGCADSDGDGIIDSLDRCANTPTGNEVDSNGCMDSDNDGVKNSADRCPNSEPGERVLRNGCAARQSVGLESIRFAIGGTELSREAHAHLVAISAVMIRSPEYRLAIQGHSDNNGSDNANYRVSRARALVVRRALIDLGVAAARIEIQAYGASMPIADNSSSEGRARNRRVAFRVIRPK
jgi:outer membrane protein OmpA-like peptidoglycan-associated protein/opacity protein-like surface antigen